MRASEGDYRSTVSLARDLRRRQTPAEKTLWAKVRDRRWIGLRVRRQVPLGGFIADFVCTSLRLVIEVDGGVHDLAAQQARDRNREEYFHRVGYGVVRLRNEDVLADCEAVLVQLAEKLGI